MMGFDVELWYFAVGALVGFVVGWALKAFFDLESDDASGNDVD